MLIATCACCNVDYTLDAWLRLPLVGVQQGEPGKQIVLRNCPCGNTMGHVVSPPAVTVPEHRAYGRKLEQVYGKLAVLPAQADARAQEALDSARELLQSYAVQAFARCGETPLTAELAASVAAVEARRAAE